MRTIFFLSLLFVCGFLGAQEPVFVKGKGYKGFIFPKEYFFYGIGEDIKEYYSPNKDDIKLAESILKDSIDVEMEKYSPYPNRPNGEPRITRKRIVKYRRQYLGYINNSGDVIVWENMLKDRSITNKELGQDIIAVMDGGSNYCNVYVNITWRRLFGLYINGIS